jgi:hypothetical protein
MPLADLLAGRLGPAGRLPDHIDELHGPVRGVVMLPRSLAMPGMRECDLGDDASRRTLYTLLLTQGNRNEIVRLVNPELLSRDWPLMKNSMDPRLARRCERQLALSKREMAGPGPKG